VKNEHNKNEDLLAAIMSERSVMAQDKLREVHERKDQATV
jgi:hypothetical protein